MPRYTHRDGDRAAARITVPGVGSVTVEDGVFEADPEPPVHEQLLELGHEPLEGDDSDASDDEGGDGVDLTDLTETEIVEMDYNTKQSIAAGYDHIPGNASSEKLTEALIGQLREEQEAE